VGRNTRNTVIHDDKVCHIQMSNRPVAAYAFVNQGYPERVIFAFLNKALDLFFERFGDKWKQFKDDDNKNVESISVEFRRFQNPKDADKLTQALGEV